MRRQKPEISLLQLELQKLNIEVHVVRRNNAITDRVDNIACNLLECWRIGNVLIADAVNLSCRHGSDRIDKRIKNEFRFTTRLNSNN